MRFRFTLNGSWRENIWRLIQIYDAIDQNQWRLEKWRKSVLIESRESPNELPRTSIHQKIFLDNPSKNNRILLWLSSSFLNWKLEKKWLKIRYGQEWDSVWFLSHAHTETDSRFATRTFTVSNGISRISSFSPPKVSFRASQQASKMNRGNLSRRERECHDKN